MTSRTIVVAHRGASARAPENTMRSFRLAAESGADAIELDVHVSADGQLAVVHDDSLDRTTDASGAVAALPMDTIRRADAGDGERVPALPEVLDWLPERLGLVVEIKARAAADAVVAAVAEHPVRRDGRLSLISFDEQAIDRVRELDPDIRTGYLLAPGQPIDAALRWAAERGHAGVHPWEGDLGADPLPILSAAHELGLLVGCYVVNDPMRMRMLAASGLWGFVTDDPHLAMETLAAG